MQLHGPGAGVGFEGSQGDLWVIGVRIHHGAGNDLVERDLCRVDVFGIDRVFLFEIGPQLGEPPANEATEDGAERWQRLPV